MLIGFEVRHYAMLHQTTVGIKWEALVKNVSFFDTNGKNDRLFPLQQMTALVGRNSTGKSSLLDAMSFVADCLKYDVQFAATLNGRGGFAKLVTHGADQCASFSLIFHNQDQQQYLRYFLEISCDEHGRPYIASEKVTVLRKKTEDDPPDAGQASPPVKTGAYQLVDLLEMEKGRGRCYDSQQQYYQKAEVNDLKHPALAAYGLLREYQAFSYLYRKISRWYFCRHGQPDDHRPRQHSTGGHKHLNHACDNIDNVLQYYQQEYKTRYKPMIKRLSEKIAEVGPADAAFYDGRMTSGSLKLFTYLLLLEDPEPRSLICLEEPESGLYHDMVEILAKAMRDYTLKYPDCQIIFVTHSPFVLEAMHPDEIWVFKRKKMPGLKANERYAQASCAGENPVVQAMHEQGVGMSAIWYSGHFDDDQET